MPFLFDCKSFPEWVIVEGMKKEGVWCTVRKARETSLSLSPTRLKNKMNRKIQNNPMESPLACEAGRDVSRSVLLVTPPETVEWAGMVRATEYLFNKEGLLEP